MKIGILTKDISHLLGDEGKRFCCQLESTGQEGRYRLKIGLRGSDNMACGLVQLEANQMLFNEAESPKLLNELKRESLILDKEEKYASH